MISNYGIMQNNLHNNSTTLMYSKKNVILFKKYFYRLSIELFKELEIYLIAEGNALSGHDQTMPSSVSRTVAIIDPMLHTQVY